MTLISMMNLTVPCFGRRNFKPQSTNLASSNSYRILSLSPNFSVTVEHNYQDSKINEYDNTSFLGFSNPSLTRFFLCISREDQMHPTEVMLELVTMVLTIAKSDADTSAADVELFSYAASSWSSSLYMLKRHDPSKKKYKPHSAKYIITMIHDVLHVGEIRNDALAKIESQTEMERNNVYKVAKSISYWAQECLKEDSLRHTDTELEEFCKNVGSNGKNVFMEIAKGHARNWRFSDFPVEAYTCFHRAYRMLGYFGHKISMGKLRPILLLKSGSTFAERIIALKTISPSLWPCGMLDTIMKH